MKSNPGMPGDPSTSKPARRNTWEYSVASAFFFAGIRTAQSREIELWSESK